VIERCTPARHLWIAVPCYSGEVKAETAAALAGATAALTMVGITASIDIGIGCPYLDHARNMLVTKFLRSDATDLLFVDADVAFRAEAAVLIAKQTRPYVAGIYRKKSDNWDWPVSFDSDELRADGDGLVEASMVPTGFLRLNRTVFDHMPCASYTDDAGKLWSGYFHCGVMNGHYGGEDPKFAADWRKLGGRIFIMPELVFSHIGRKAWEGSWGNWMRSQAA
jgi:hypothetical protein